LTVVDGRPAHPVRPLAGLLLALGFVASVAGLGATLDDAPAPVSEDTAAAPAPLPAFVPDGRRHLDPVFGRWADEYRVPVTLVEALAWHESEWDNTVVSPAGAIGIGQLLPETAATIAGQLGEDLSPSDPEENIQMTASYLANLVEQYQGDTRTALAAYAQGSTSIAADGITPETNAVVDSVLELQQEFAAARA
jgi:soluble lytic murein transglycosylase-like protein